MNLDVKVVAILCLTVLEAVAIITGLDGAYLLPVVAVISGLAGYHIQLEKSTGETTIEKAAKKRKV